MSADGSPTGTENGDRSTRAGKVETIMREMKDTSELMVDLAYSAVFYDSKQIAEEVVALEEEMGGYLTDLQRHTLEAVRQEELPIDNALVLIRVAQTAEVIANSALEIADVVLRDLEPHPVLAESIRDSESTVAKVVLHPDSAYGAKKLRDLELETETGMRILAVKRDGRWHSGVTGGFRLQAGDLLIAMGPDESVPDFAKACDPHHEEDDD